MAERDYGAEAQKAAEEHLIAVWNWFYKDQDLDTPVPEKDPSSAPFDGCPTCEIREILFAAWPIIWEGLKSGDLTQEDVIKAGTHGE